MERQKRIGVSLAIALVMSLCAATTTYGQDDDGQDPFQQGQQLLGQGKFAEAAEAFKEAVEADEENANAIFFLGYCQHMAGDLENALKTHKKAAEFEQFAPIATYNIGCANSLLGNREQAFAALNKAVELGYQDENQFNTDSDLDSLRLDNRFAVLMARVVENEELETQLVKAQELLNEGEFADAAEVYTSLIDENKDNGFVVFRLGYALHGAGQLDEALEYHERATEFRPFKGIANYNLGCAYSLKGEKELAIESLKKAAKAGFTNLNYLREDPDLDSIREEPGFVQLIEWIESESNDGDSDDESDSDDGEDR